MEQNEDGSYNIYTCPSCKEEYYDFREMMDCWKSDTEQSK